MHVIEPGDRVVIRIHKNVTLSEEENAAQEESQRKLWIESFPGCTFVFIVTESHNFGVDSVYRPQRGGVAEYFRRS